MANFASSSVKPLTVLTEDDGVPGSKIEQDPENYTVEQLKRWLKCRGLKQSGKRGEIVQRVSDCLKGPTLAAGSWSDHGRPCSDHGRSWSMTMVDHKMTMN